MATREEISTIRAMPRYSSCIIDVPSSAITSSSIGRVYWYLALAALLTFVGVGVGATFALPIITSGWVMLLLLVEIALIWTAPTWVKRSPMNQLLFFLFPLLSGFTITPFILSVALQYANGAVILLNASIATCLLCAASAVYVSITKADLTQKFGLFLFQSLIGLIIFGILQIFFPIFRGTAFEMILSGVGIVTFALFLAMDMQRVVRRSGVDHPMLLALALYLDIFNLFLYVVRFMIAISGNRR